MNEDFDKWLNKQNKIQLKNARLVVTGNETNIFVKKIEIVSVRALAEKIAYMSRAEMTIMRTYFRKQVNWKAGEK